jgi:uncharacterized 2Fe-2S/4Fe-4S cluster protein (DUF4445 family)
MSVIVKITDNQELINTCNGKLGDSLYSILSNHGIDPGGFCGARGYCGKCKLLVIEGKDLLTEYTSTEKTHLTEEEISHNIRLACQARIKQEGELIIKILSEPWIKAIIYGIKPSVSFDPAIKMLEVTIPKPTITKYFTPSEVINTLLTEKFNCNNVYYSHYETLYKLTRILTNPRRSLCIIYKYHTATNVCEILDVDEQCKAIYGLAIDIGTTKVAYKIIDLLDGSTLYADYFENPQIVWGADIITRLSVAIEKGTHVLSSVLINKLNEILEKISKRIDNSKIYEIVVVGNSAMIYLFLGLDVKNLAIAPYEILWREPLYITAAEVGLKTNKGSSIFIPPLVGGFIGPDSLVGAYIAWLFESSNSPWLFIDIGTNTEIFLYKDKKILATSAAAGPAFEGMHISCGVRSMPGAIEKIKIEPETHKPIIKTVLNKPPVGITGTGIVDLVSELLKIGVLSKDGKILPTSRRVKHYGKERCFIIAYKEEFGNTNEIYFSQKDVREVQKAIGAIKTAIKILLKRAEIPFTDISTIYLAGSFGSTLDISSAKNIGLIPPLSDDRIKYLGNSALSGAELLLLNKDLRGEVEKFRGMISYLELSALPEFNKEFINNLNFTW